VSSAGRPPAPEPEWVDDIEIRLLGAAESGRLVQAIRAVYGETYPVRWTYDADEVARRISAGLLISAIAQTSDGELICHSGLSFNAPGDVVGHAGQALTLPAARGRHIYTAVKRYLIAWANELDLMGMYSEAVATHPYSQRALLDLGGHETGFLLGFMPGSVDDGVSKLSTLRQSAALFFLRLRPGEERTVYAPGRHREIVRETIEVCHFRSRLAPAPARATLPAESNLHVVTVPGDNVAEMTVIQAGRDLTHRVDAERGRLFADGLDAVYVDLPLDRPETAHLSESLEELKLSYSGIFPNQMASGDVLRLQCLRDATALSHDVAVASAHGTALLEYVIADMEAAGQVVRRDQAPAPDASAAGVPLVTRI
jgi:serine/threonine-protein kinase RsbW